MSTPQLARTDQIKASRGTKSSYVAENSYNSTRHSSSHIHSTDSRRLLDPRSSHYKLETKMDIAASRIKADCAVQRKQIRGS